MKLIPFLASITLTFAGGYANAANSSFACLVNVCIGDSLTTVAEKLGPNILNNIYFKKLWDRFPVCSLNTDGYNSPGAPLFIPAEIKGGGRMLVFLTRALPNKQGDHYIVEKVEASYPGSFTQESIQEAFRTLVFKNEVFRDKNYQLPMTQQWVAETRPESISGFMRGGAVFKVNVNDYSLVTAQSKEIKVSLIQNNWPEDFSKEYLDNKKLDSQPGCPQPEAPIVTALPPELKQSTGGAAYKHPLEEQAERNKFRPQSYSSKIENYLYKLYGGVAFFSLFVTAVLSIVLGLRVRIPLRYVVRAAVSGLVPVGFTFTISHLMAGLQEKHSNKVISEEEDNEIMAFISEVDQETRMEQYVFNGILKGLSLSSKFLVAFIPAIALYGLISGDPHHRHFGVGSIVFCLLVLPAWCRAGEVVLIPIREVLDGQVIYSSWEKILVIKLIVNALLFIASAFIGAFVLPYYAVKLFWKYSRVLSVLDAGMSSLPEKT